MKTTTLRLAVAVCGIVSLVSPALILAAGSPAPQSQGQAAQKNWKDRDEYDLYTSITTEANAQKKLDLLNQWQTKYPNTDFKTERTTLYLTTYVGLGRPKDAVGSAKQLLADNPKDFTGLYYVTLLTLQALDTSPGALDDSEKGAAGLIGALDDQFAAAKKPASVSDADWAKARSDTEAMAHTTLGWVAMQRKDNVKAEQEFTKSLQLSPASGQVSYWLGTVILAQKDPAKQAAALYDFARATAYDGPGALSASFRQTVRTYLEKVYASYHGSKDGLDDLLAATKASALPPGDFKIKSADDIEKEKAAKEEADRKANPSLALWKSIRDALTGPDGANYFTANAKDTKTPMAFNGKLVSESPDVKPKTLVLAISDSDGKVADATINLDAALPGKADAGTSITFEGVFVSYTASPFMVTFSAAKTDIKGWPGKEAPVHHPVRKRPAAQ